MLFNPAESVDFEGNTGPFIQYTHARICSLLRRAQEQGVHYEQAKTFSGEEYSVFEKELTRLLFDFPDIISQAADTFSPALLANYLYELTRTYNKFYQEVPVLKAAKEAAIRRLALSSLTGRVIKTGMGLLGITVPERM